MKRLKYSPPRKALEKLFTCRIRPIIEYGNLVYDNCPKHLSNRLEQLQMEAGVLVSCVKQALIKY